MQIPLIDEALYQRLINERNHMGGDTARLAPVFVPVGPDPDDGAPLRLLFVGQTAYEWDDGKPSAYDRALPLADAARTYASNLRRLLVEDEHPFWQAVRRVSEQVLEALGAAELAARERLHEVVGWSNVAKIHHVQGDSRNPPNEFAIRQREVCAASLQAEVRRMRPTAVVLMSGGTFGAEIVRDAFGPDEAWWQNARGRDRVAGLRSEWLGAAVLWSNHPGWMRWQKEAVEREDLGVVAGYVTAVALGSTPGG